MTNINNTLETMFGFKMTKALFQAYLDTGCNPKDLAHCYYDECLDTVFGIDFNRFLNWVYLKIDTLDFNWCN